nr:hypothetical protein [Cellulosimicrobium sp. MM]
MRSTSPVTLPAGNAAGAANVVDYRVRHLEHVRDGRGPAPSPTTCRSINRTGYADTDDNSKDLTLSSAVTPQNSGDDGGGPGPEPGEVVPIAEIQGTGAASPLVGQTVTTRGVVTATYPTGGYDGFYLQTEGTGGDLDASHTASDAIFVYSKAGAAAVAVGDHVEVTGRCPSTSR